MEKEVSVLKKLISLILAFALCFSAAGTAFAGTQAEASAPANRLEQAAQQLADAIEPYAEKAVVTAKTDDWAFLSALLDVFTEAGATELELPEAYARTAGPRRAPAEDPAGSGNPITGGKYSVGELTGLIRKYMFIKIDDPAQAAALIADTTEFSYALVEDGKGTLYLTVNVEENPQIFNYDVFRALVEQLYARQNEEMQKDDYGKIDYVMSYEHIAGELALHTVVFAATNLILDVTKTQDEKIINLYKSAAQATLNADEARAPGALIRFIGTLIINVFTFNFLKLFSFLA